MGFKNLDKSFYVDEISDDKHVVKKIDGNGARTSLFRKLNLCIAEEDIVYQLYKKAFYYPLGFKKEELWHAGMIGLIYGENLVFANKIEKKELNLLSLSIEHILKNLNRSLAELSKEDVSCIFGFACETYIETLGKEIFKIHNAFEELRIPFLLVFVAGESITTPKIGGHHLYESANLLAFSK